MTALREARTARNLRLVDLAQASGLQPSRISLLERNRARLTVDDLHAIAKAIGMDDLARAIEPFRQEAAA